MSVPLPTFAIESLLPLITPLSVNWPASTPMELLAAAQPAGPGVGAARAAQAARAGIGGPGGGAARVDQARAGQRQLLAGEVDAALQLQGSPGADRGSGPAVPPARTVRPVGVRRIRKSWRGATLFWLAKAALKDEIVARRCRGGDENVAGADGRTGWPMHFAPWRPRHCRPGGR